MGQSVPYYQSPIMGHIFSFPIVAACQSPIMGHLFSFSSVAACQSPNMGHLFSFSSVAACQSPIMGRLFSFSSVTACQSPIMGQLGAANGPPFKNRPIEKREFRTLREIQSSNLWGAYFYLLFHFLASRRRGIAILYS